MTNGARSFLKYTKTNTFKGLIAPGFKFYEPNSPMYLKYFHKIEKLIPRTGELVITSTSPSTSDKKTHWIIGTNTMLIHLETGVFKKIINEA